MSDFKQVMDKLEVMDARLDKIDITLAEQAKDLKYHIKRTDILEEKLQPVEDHVKAVNFMMKALAKTIMIVGGVITVVIAVYKAFKA